MWLIYLGLSFDNMQDCERIQDKLWEIDSTKVYVTTDGTSDEF
jgi:hypothetical protein